MFDLKARLTSRKLWLTIATYIAPFISALHLTSHEKALIYSIAGPVYVISEAVVDAVRAKQGPGEPPAPLNAAGLFPPATASPGTAFYYNSETTTSPIPTGEAPTVPIPVEVPVETDDKVDLPFAAGPGQV